MNQFWNFVLNHWMLWVALVVVIILILLEEMRRNVGGVLKVSAQQVIRLINHDDAVIIDIRSANEFQQGHVLSAVNACKQDFANKIGSLSKYKSKKVVVFGGGQSAMAVAMQLKKNGFTSLYLLDGGVVAWRKADLPLVMK